MKKLLQGIIVLLMVLVVGFFGLKDTIIKKGLEKTLINSLGTNVRIYGVDYSVFKELLELKGIGIESKENDAYDIVHIGNITTKLNYKELFNKKIRLNSVDIKDIGINVKTDRKNTKQPLLNARQEVVAGSNERLSDEEIKKMADIVINNYELLAKVSEKDITRFNIAKGTFLAATTPIIDKFIDYKISSIAEEYMVDIIKEYRALSNNIQIGLKEASNMDWSVEIGNINISTKLFDREFKGNISEISTDKTKMDKNIVFVLDSLNGNEIGKISGEINLYKMQGYIDTKIDSVDITEVKEIADYVRGFGFLNQKIVLSKDNISINGNAQVKDIKIFKENIAKQFLNDKDAIDKIVENASDTLGDIKISYGYDPQTKIITIKNNVAEQIGVYMGADTSQLKKLEREFKEKYGDKIEKGKEELKSKLEGFLKSFK